MSAKKPSEYTQEEVCVWLNAIGLGSRIPDFQENAVDGPLLSTLTVDDLQGDLGLSSLQVRKFHQSLQFANNLAGGGYDQSRLMALEAENRTLRQENASLNEVIKVLQAQQNPTAAQQPAPAPYYAPAPAPYYAPAPAPAPHYAPAPAAYAAPAPTYAPPPSHRSHGKLWVLWAHGVQRVISPPPTKLPVVVDITLIGRRPRTEGCRWRSSRE